MAITCKYSDWTRGQVEALLNTLGGDEVAKNILSGKVKVTVEEIKDLLLELIGTVTVSATIEKFVAKDRFVVNTNDDAQVKISHVWDNFCEWFLKDDGKIEDPIGEQTLCYAKLRKASVGGPIIVELGGEAKAETTLSEMFSLMEIQKNGEAGVLLNNGYANIFYIRDRNGVLRVVCVYWCDDGWYVYASSVEYPRAWSAGDQVLSRNSCVLQPSDISVPASV